METVSTVMEAWEAFFTAQLGAAATLGGLVFVGLSLNLTKILAAPSLPNRALMALFVLLGILLVSSYALIPGQSAFLIGLEIGITGLVLAIYGTIVEVHTLRRLQVQNVAGFVANMILLELAFLPYVVGGLLLIAGNGNGLYWIAGGVIWSFVKAVADAWVLLVEINR